MLFVIFILFPWTNALENCEHTINLGHNEVQKIQSPNYPNEHGPGTSCQWFVKAEPEDDIVLNCPFPYKAPEPVLGAPEETLRCLGRFEVRPGGDNTEPLCTNRAFVHSANTNNLLIKYASEGTDDGFVCFVYAEKNQVPDVNPPDEY